MVGIFLAASGLGRSAGETQAIEFESGPPPLRGISELPRPSRSSSSESGGETIRVIT